MKFKLSLVAVLAAGSLSGLGAVSFEEAFRGFETDGFVRYRFDHYKIPNSTDPKLEEKGAQGRNQAQHRFTSEVNFKAALDDNFYAGLSAMYDNIEISGDHINGGVSYSQSAADGYDSKFSVRKYYVGYKTSNGFNDIRFGRQTVGQFFTDDMVGTGLTMTNTAVEGFRLQAYYFDNLENDGDITTGSLAYGTSYVNDVDKGAPQERTYKNDLYGVAISGDFNPVYFNVGYGLLNNVYGLFYFDLGSSFYTSRDVGFNFRGQYAMSQVDGTFADKVKRTTEEGDFADAKFAGVEAGATVYGVDARVGYVKFYTEEYKNSLISFEDQGSFITAGQDLLDYRWIKGDNSYMFADLSYTYSKVKVGATYVTGKQKNYDISKPKSSAKRSEIVVAAKYNYNKKLELKTYYSMINDETRVDKKQNHWRFEAVYNF